MRPIVCSGEVKHHFDGDKYAVCPVCGKPPAAVSVAPEEPVQKTAWISKPKNLMSKLIPKKKEDNKIINVNKANNTETVGMFKNEKLAPVNEVEDVLVKDNNVPNLSHIDSSIQKPVTDSYTELRSFSPEMEFEKSESDEVEVADSLSSLKNELDKVKSDNQGRTVGYFSSSNDDQSSIEPVDPVVGWLVSIKGPQKGQSFPIVSGKNSIGRNTTNSIVIANDEKVSRESHAYVIYEPKKRAFYIQPGDGRGLLYLNDEMLMTPSPLNKQDRIELGASILILVPLCGEDFSWEDYED